MTPRDTADTTERVIRMHADDLDDCCPWSQCHETHDRTMGCGEPEHADFISLADSDARVKKAVEEENERCAELAAGLIEEWVHMRSPVKSQEAEDALCDELQDVMKKIRSRGDKTGGGI